MLGLMMQHSRLMMINQDEYGSFVVICEHHKQRSHSEIVKIKVLWRTMNLEKGGRGAIERMVEAYGFKTRQALCDHLGI